MNWIDDRLAVLPRKTLKKRRPDQGESGGPPGSFSFGTGSFGGPDYTDRYRTQRAPTSWELLQHYKSICFTCVSINEKAVVRVPLRLYVDGSGPGARPRSACDPHRVDRSTFRRLRSEAYTDYCRVAPGTADDVFEIRQHPLIRVLDSPDPYGYFDRVKLLSLIVRYNDTIGQAYFWPDGPKNGPPNWLWPLFSQYVQPIPLDGSPLVGSYTYFGEYLPYDSVLRFVGNQSLKNPYAAGYSPLYAAIEYAKLEDAFVAIQEQILGSGGRPSVVISPKDANVPWGEPERKRFEQDFGRRHAGGNAGRPYVTNTAVSVEPIQWPPADLGSEVLSNDDRREIANCFGVPPTMLTTETNLANIEAANQMHARNAVEPRCHMIASTLTRWARRFDPRLFWAFDPAIPEDELKKAQVWDMKIKNGSATWNEAREETPFPPLEAGDEPWIPGTLVQPSMAIEQHQMGIESGKAAIEQGTAAIGHADKGLEQGDKKLEIEKEKVKVAAKQKDKAAKDKAARDKKAARTAAIGILIDQEIEAIRGSLGTEGVTT